MSKDTGFTVHSTLLPHNDPDASLANCRDSRGVIDNERGAMEELMAKGNWSIFLVAPTSTASSIG